MKRVAVDLDHETPVRPVQIDLVTGHARIHQRSGEAEPPHFGGEPAHSRPLETTLA
jgi:hypothetical protein